MRLILMAGMLSLLMYCTSTLPEETYYTNAKKAYTAQKFDDAIDNYVNLIEKYPKGKHRPESLFMIGYIYANDLKKLDDARTYYNRFIKEYPDHELVQSARWELKTLGKEVNEIPFIQELSADSSAAQNSAR